jgi:hypothetical protein
MQGLVARKRAGRRIDERARGETLQNVSDTNTLHVQVTWESHDLVLARP